jgi:putative transposase
MPNHLHGIVIVPGDEGGRSGTTAPTGNAGSTPDGAPTRASLGEVIQRFKTWTTKQYQASLPKGDSSEMRHILWQRDYYEHVIRNAVDLADTREYILNNAMKWHLDHENPDIT